MADVSEIILDALLNNENRYDAADAIKVYLIERGVIIK